MMLICLNDYLTYFQVGELSASDSNSTDKLYCRERSDIRPFDEFALHSCASCYSYLFPINKELRAYNQHLVSLNGTRFPHMTFIKADYHNESLKNAICSTLNSDECHRWQSCCEEAEECCKKKGYPHPEYDSLHFKDTCPRTWDGYGCWDDTPSATTVSIHCPLFIPHVMPSCEFLSIEVHLPPDYHVDSVGNSPQPSLSEVLWVAAA